MGALRAMTPSRAAPWFRERPRTAVLVASALFIGILLLQVAVVSPEDDLSMLYVMPIALLAIAFGCGVGIVAGIIGVGAVITGALIGEVSLSPFDWATRVTPLLLLGALLGYAADRLQDASLRERQLTAVLLLQREAAELNDSIVQELAVAKWRFEAGDHDGGLEMLTDTVATAQALVTRMLGPTSAIGPAAVVDRSGSESHSQKGASV